MIAIITRSAILKACSLLALLALGSPALGLIDDIVEETASGGQAAAAPPVTVVVRGESAESFDDARQKALREAVERVCGAYVKSETGVENFALVYDRITSAAAGFGQVEVMDQGERKGRYWVIARVTVSEKPMLEMLKASGMLRQWRVAVLLPETHLARPRIPDPAAETRLIRELTEAGYRVIDRDFSQEYRYDSVVGKARRGDISALKLLLTKTRADILVIGEAFSQRPARDAPELAVNGMVGCRGRVELRAIVKATNEILTADSAQSSSVDITEEIAGKVALENAASEVAARLVDKLLYLPGGVTRQVEVVISGFGGYAQAEKVQARIARLSGVKSVSQDDYQEGTLYLDVTVDSLTAESFAGKLEKAFGGKLEVGETNKFTVRAVWRG